MLNTLFKNNFRGGRVIRPVQNKNISKDTKKKIKSSCVAPSSPNRAILISDRGLPFRNAMPQLRYVRYVYGLYAEYVYCI